MRDVAQSSVTTAAVLVLNLCTSVLAARLLLPEGRGEFAAVAQIWVPILATITGLGLDQAATYFAARKSEDRAALWGAILLIAPCLVAPLLLLGWYVLAQVLANYDPALIASARIYLIVIGPQIILGPVLSGLLSGMQAFASWNLLRLTSPAIYLAGIGVLILIGEVNPSGFIFAFGAASSFNMLLLLYLLRRAGLPRPKAPGPMLWTVLKYGGVLHVATLFAVAASRLDQMAVASFLDQAQLGLYAVACSLAALPGSLVAPFTSLLLAKASAREGDDRATTAHRYFYLSFAVWLATVPLLLIAAEWLLSLLFGAAFAPAGSAVRIIVLGTALQSLRAILIQAQRAEGRPLPGTISIIIASGAVAGGLWLLLPTWGLHGAAVSFLLGQIAGMSFLLVYMAARQGALLCAIVSPRLDDLGYLRTAFSDLLARKS